jgi:hypothetical protein
MRACLLIAVAALLCSACTLPRTAGNGLIGAPERPDTRTEPGGTWPVSRHVGDGVSRNLHPFVFEHEDGPWLYFASDRDGRSFDIYRRHLRGFAAERLTHLADDALWPRVSPDGTRMAFAGRKDGRWRVYVLALSSHATPAQVSAEWSGDCIQPAWSTDGASLAYAAWSEIEQEWTLHLVGMSAGTGGWGHSLLLTGEGRPVRGMHPCFGADGVISFQAAPTAGRRWYELRRFDPRSGRISSLHALRDHGAIQPAFRADGARMVAATVGKATRRAQTGDGFVLLDAGGGFETDVRAPGGMSRVSSPHWAVLDGRDYIFFSAAEDGGESIWSVPVGEPVTEAPKQLPGLASR